MAKMQEKNQWKNVPALLGIAGDLARTRISDEQRGLEEDQAGDPHGGRSAEDREQLPRGDGLDKEEQKRRQKDRSGKQQPLSGHAYLKSSEQFSCWI